MTVPVPTADFASREQGGGTSAPIVLAGLTKRFAANEVLRGIDLAIPAGQFVAVIGKSGCGKSTLLRLLAGLDTPTSGTCRIGDGGRPATVRVMFQEPRLLPWRRVLGNVEVGLPDKAGPQARDRALAALQAVELAEKAGDWPAVLSGGQRQRVALARALVSRPQVLLFDEPLGALDALTRIAMQTLLERVWLEQGFTAMMVTHDVAEAVALANRIVVIEAGRIVADRPVDLPRPRRRGSAEAAAIEAEILATLFGGAAV
jgi:sulfonate transport system ATP-binding protein